MLTIHFLTEDFEMKTYVLEVRHLTGSHTTDFIRTSMIYSIACFGLDKDKLVSLLRDNASNGVNVHSNDLSITPFGCIGHALNLVVGQFLIEKKSGQVADEVIEEEPAENTTTLEANDDDDNDDIAEFEDLYEEQTVDEIISIAYKLVAGIQVANGCQAVCGDKQCSGLWSLESSGGSIGFFRKKVSKVLINSQYY